MSNLYFSIFCLTILVYVAGCSSDDKNSNPPLQEEPLTFVPDDAFEQFLIDSGYDDILDNQVITSVVSQIEVLDMTDIPVTNLTGLEDFSALRKFLVRSTGLTSFDPAPNTNLTYLSTNGCTNLTALNVAALSRLDTLYMSNNNSIVNLDVSANNRMRSLHVIADNLESLILPQGDPTSFIDLILVNSKLQVLDLSAYTNLRTLELYDNQLVSLDLSAQTELELLDCSGNPLTALDLSSGGNADLLSMDARTGFGTLPCIQIDPGFTPPDDGSWLKDPETEYSDDCL